MFDSQLVKNTMSTEEVRKCYTVLPCPPTIHGNALHHNNPAVMLSQFVVLQERSAVFEALRDRQKQQKFFNAFYEMHSFPKDLARKDIRNNFVMTMQKRSGQVKVIKQICELLALQHTFDTNRIIKKDLLEAKADELNALLDGLAVLGIQARSPSTADSPGECIVTLSNSCTLLTSKLL